MKRSCLLIPLIAFPIASCAGASGETCFAVGCDAVETTSLAYRHLRAYPMGPPVDMTARACEHHAAEARGSDSGFNRHMHQNGLIPR